MPIFPILCAILTHLALCHGTTQCVNTAYTRLIDSEIQRLRYIDLTHHDYINATLSAFVETSMCRTIPVTQHTLFNYRSMCPWRYVPDIDHDRFPVRLNMAKCMCSTCAHNFQCKPVLYTIPVLKKQCVDGVNHWVQKMQLISVSCYCARPPIIRVRKRLDSQRRWNNLGMQQVLRKRTNPPLYDTNSDLNKKSVRNNH